MNSLKIGTIETVYKVINKTVDPLAFFNRLRHMSTDAFLLESADIKKQSGERSIGCVDPCLKVVIKDNKFNISALNSAGKKLLSIIKDDLKFVKDMVISDDNIVGNVMPEHCSFDEDAKLKQKSVFDIIRAIVFKFKPRLTLDFPFCGMFGAVSYDAIDYFENLPEQQLGIDLPDMEFYLADKLFVMDHMKNKTYLIANIFVTGISSKDDYYRCVDVINRYEKVFNECSSYHVPDVKNYSKLVVSVPDKEFEHLVCKIKKHIAEGDIFQAVLSRTFRIKISDNPLNIYQKLKEINPGPYMFYFQNQDYCLLGSSPETCVKVSKDRIVEIKPIAGTLPRSEDDELDSRYELDLLLNEKELAEHCMLIDLARNDVAKVSDHGTRKTTKLLTVEKFSHVQHLVSTVRGKLRDDLDALHAYQATMNMGTLTGAPKIKAMELIRKYEQEKRGFYGGAVCYLTCEGEFDSCIVIRAITVKDNIALVRAGAGIVYDSDPKKEADETKRKAAACLNALGAGL